MNNLEHRLRDAFGADADTVRDVLPLAAYEPAVPPAKARLKRVTRVLVPLTAAAAVAAAAIGVALIPKQSPGSNPAASAGPVPRFAVVTEGQLSASRSPDAIDTVEVATGRVIDRLPELPHHQIPIAVSAFGAPGQFVVEAMAKRDCAVWLYQFRLTPTGDLADLRPLAVPKISGVPELVLSQREMAASAGAPIVVSVTAPCKPNHGQGLPQLHVINVATKKVTTWTLPNNASPGGPDGLTVSGNGRLVGLAVGLSTKAGHARFTGYIVPANSPSGPIARHWRKVTDYPEEAATGLAVTPGGKTMIASLIARKPPGHYALDLIVDSTRRHSAPNEVTAEAVISVFRFFSGPLTFSLDHSGHYLLIGSGSDRKGRGARTAVINLASDHVTKVPNLIIHGVSSIAW